MPPVAAAPEVPDLEAPAAPAPAPEPVVRLVLGLQLSVVLAPFMAALHCASVAKLQLSTPESLPLRQNAPDCCATAAGAAAKSIAATSAEEAIMVFMGVPRGRFLSPHSQRSIVKSVPPAWNFHIPRENLVISQSLRFIPPPRRASWHPTRGRRRWRACNCLRSRSPAGAARWRRLRSADCGLRHDPR